MKNKSTTYVLPLIMREFMLSDKKIDTDLLIAYLKNTYCFHEKYLNTLTLEFCKKDCEIIKELLDRIKLSSIFVEEYSNNVYVALTLEIPKNVIESYTNYYQGNYSKIKQEDQLVILNFLKKLVNNNYLNQDIYAKVRQILSRSKLLREKLKAELELDEFPEEWEVASKPDKLSETFKIYK